MKIALENVDLNSSSGPNSFGQKLVAHLKDTVSTSGTHAQFTNISDADIALCFIESTTQINIPRVLRLDGIYFNSAMNYDQLNFNIKHTYDRSQGIIFQSEFNKKLITKYFGEHNNSVVIHNGADVETISKIPAYEHNYNNLWICASQWRPHKRLDKNIRYFLEHKEVGDHLIVAGNTPSQIEDPRITYVGQLNQNQLYSLYKSAKYFLHLAWLDHCPNVVVDARACGCHIICTNAGGTVEIAGPNSTIIDEDEWDFKPVALYEPPNLDFSKKIDNVYNVDYNMNIVASKYLNFIKDVHASSH